MQSDWQQKEEKALLFYCSLKISTHFRTVHNEVSYFSSDSCTLDNLFKHFKPFTDKTGKLKLSILF